MVICCTIHDSNLQEGLECLNNNMCKEISTIIDVSSIFIPTSHGSESHVKHQLGITRYWDFCQLLPQNQVKLSPKLLGKMKFYVITIYWVI